MRLQAEVPAGSWPTWPLWGGGQDDSLLEGEGGGPEGSSSSWAGTAGSQQSLLAGLRRGAMSMLTGLAGLVQVGLRGVLVGFGVSCEGCGGQCPC